MSEKMYDENLETQYVEYKEPVIARCEECGELIYEDNNDIYVDDEGNYFCSLECALDYYSIRRIDGN